MLTLTGLDELKEHEGQEVGVSDWHEVTQEAINEFAEVTGDHNWIHVDVERAKKTPFGGTIAHGYYTLSLAPKFSYSLMSVEGFAFGVNYGVNRVRFPAPLKVGARVRMQVELAEVKELDAGAEAVYHLTYEVDGEPKPCCVADLVFRYYS